MEVNTENVEDVKLNLDMLNTLSEQPLLGPVTTLSNVEGIEVKSQQMKPKVNIKRTIKKMEAEAENTEDIKPNLDTGSEQPILGSVYSDVEGPEIKCQQIRPKVTFKKVLRKMEADMENTEDTKPNLDVLNTVSEQPLLGSIHSNVEGPEVKSQQIKSKVTLKKVARKMEADTENTVDTKPNLDMLNTSSGQPLLGSILSNVEGSEVRGQQIRPKVTFKKVVRKMEVDIENTEDIRPHLDMLNTLSEEPLLGSVTTFSNVEGPEVKGQQIRSSARVFKKMKLDLIPPIVTIVTEKREKKEDNKPDIKKCYRPLWTSDDKSIFFEALNEFGKDFESIQVYISTKLKKKGFPENVIKTKDQVRHLYYRSWQKISKYVKFAEGIKKVVQELYGLINYGELRKKIGSGSQKALLKLNELIYKGSTMLRIKGKTIRVKTPMCRALRRINQLDEKYDEIELPNRITVELRPKDMTSYLKVQSMAQNPRLKTVLPLQKRLSSLISCVNKRWKTVDAKVYDKAVISTSAVTNNCVPPSNVSEENKVLLTPPLRFIPPSGCRIEVPSINLSEYFTRQSICLISYEHRVGITNNSYANFYSYHNYKSSRKGYRPRTDSASDKLEKSTQKTSASQTEDNDMCDTTDNALSSKVNKVVDDAVNTILSLQQTENQETDDETIKIKTEKKEEAQSDILNEQKQAVINNIRRGWTETESQSLTLGEVYLMCGSDSKLVLEYAWDKSLKEEKEAMKEATNAYEPREEPSGDISDDGTKDLDLSVSLSKLLSVAKLHYRKNIIKCPCGHVCGTKNDMRLKRAMESKIRKILTDIDKCADENEDKIVPDENIFENEPSFVAAPVYMQSNIQLSPATYFHPPSTPMIHLVSQIDSIQRLKPRYLNRRGRRSRSKQVVVERKLPLLPNNVESGHQIVRMNIISQDDSTSGEQAIFDNKNVITTENHNIFISQDHHSISNSVFPEESQCSSDIMTKALRSSDVELELTGDDTMIPTAPSSPSRILKESDNHWINSEVADYSLSSLLGHLESPMKANSSAPSLANDDSRMSQDVDAQLQSLLSESSVDFSANFADLAAQVANEIKN